MLTDCFAAEHNQTLELYGLRSPGDTGAYKCTARNVAGSVQDIATVFVQQRAQLTDNERTSPAFHSLPVPTRGLHGDGGFQSHPRPFPRPLHPSPPTPLPGGR